MQPNLFAICVSALASVFAVLAFLAVVMRVLIAVFKDKNDESDAMLIAAINSTYRGLFPGTKITNVEEVK
jgi:hypothetical protein